MSSKAAKKPIQKAAKKAATITVAQKKPTAKQTAKAPSKRATTASLALALKSLESRLKGADTKNRNALKSLEAVVAEMKNAAKTGQTQQKAALTRGLNALEVQMETYLSRASEQARAGVRAELSAVTAPGADVETLENALQSAHAKLEQIETSQRDSIARLNRHIAGLATSVEARLVQEEKARKASAAALDTKINTVNQRVDQVEIETATALEAIGDKVAEFAAVLDDRAKQSDAETAERLADLAKETQSDFQYVQTDMTARLEALETIAANWSPTEAVFPANMEDPRVDQMANTVMALQDELGRLHARLATVQNGVLQNGPIQNQPEPTATPQMIREVPSYAAPTNVIPLAVSHTAPNPYAEAAQALEASTPDPILPIPPAAKSKKVEESHIPQEFDPSAYQPKSAPYEGLQNTQPNAHAPLTPPAALEPSALQPASPQPAAPVQQIPTPPIAPPMASQGGHIPAAPHPTVIDPVMPAPLPVSTYADPAYAEDNDMRAERVAGDTRKPSLPKLPISGQNLRIGALAVGVAAAGLITAKIILGGSDAPTQNARNDILTQETQVETIPFIQNEQGQNERGNAATIDLAQPDAIVPTPPLGTYAETRTPEIAPSQQNTLEQAVLAGNPIAQFQKGLAKLQAGDAEEAARLIRLAANRNQPAAQYRLAKLYETGTGVAEDTVTARELVERAAIGGNRIAMHDLGNYYASGEGGIGRDMNKALEWFTKAAERGVVDSQFNVGYLKEGNEGVPADTHAALFWYYIAARQGDQGAPERVSIVSEQIEASKRAEIKSRADRFNPKPIDEAANGIFRNVPWINTQASNKTARNAQIIKIREAQTLLTDLGYEIGGADGAAGPKTRAAIRAFEKVNGLPETGKITDDLIERLEIAAGA